MSPSTPSERVAVVVVLYNCRDLLPDFVATLAPGLGPLPYELVGVDNASPDDSVSELERLAPGATVVRTGRNGGYSAGVNAGVAAAGPHTAVLVLNPDVRLGENCVPELLHAARSPGIGIAVPRLTDARGDLIESMRREPTILRAWGDALLGTRRAGRVARLGEVVVGPHHYSARQQTDWAEGSTQLITAETWRACGPWDESFFLYSEEAEFDLRARDRGYSTVYVPTAHAVHLEGGSGTSPALWSLLVANQVRFFRRRHGRVATLAFWGATVVREAKRAAIGRPTSRAALRTLLNPRRLRAAPGPA